MAILEQVMQMQNQGISEEEITRSLREQGFSPGDIDDALNQAQVKNAVTGEQSFEDSAPQNLGQGPGTYTPQTQEMNYVPQANIDQNYSQQQYPQQDYYQQDQGYSSQANEADTIIEISEQVFAEKIKKIRREMDLMNEFRTLSQVKIDRIEERLRRMESLIDRLQIEILGKIGNYGRDLQKTQKELAMVQDSFGKVVNPLVNKKPSAKRKTTKRKTSRKK